MKKPLDLAEAVSTAQSLSATVAKEPLPSAPMDRLSVERIDQAMSSAGGDRKAAAKMLQINTARLGEKIREMPELNAKWHRPTDMEKAELAAFTVGENREVVILESEKDLAAMIAREDAKLKQGFAALGCTEEQVALAVNLKAFAGRNIETTMQLGNSGLAVNLLNMLGQLRRYEARMAENNFTKNLRGDSTEEAMVMGFYKALLEEYRKAVELCNKGTFLMARIEGMRRLSNINKADAKKARPGFRPKGDVNVVATNVVVQHK